MAGHRIPDGTYSSLDPAVDDGLNAPDSRKRRGTTFNIHQPKSAGRVSGSVTRYRVDSINPVQPGPEHESSTFARLHSALNAKVTTFALHFFCRTGCGGVIRDSADTVGRFQRRLMHRVLAASAGISAPSPSDGGPNDIDRPRSAGCNGASRRYP